MGNQVAAKPIPVTVLRLSDHGSPLHGGPNFKRCSYDPCLLHVGMTANEFQNVATRADQEGRSVYASVLATPQADMLIVYRNCFSLAAWRVLRPYWFTSICILLSFVVRCVCACACYCVCAQTTQFIAADPSDDWDIDYDCVDRDRNSCVSRQCTNYSWTARDCHMRVRLSMRHRCHDVYAMI